MIVMLTQALAVPAGEMNASTARMFLHRLLGVSLAVDVEELRPHLSEHAAVLLHRAECFPFDAPARALIRAADWQELEPRDIVRVATNLLDRCSTLEKHCRVGSVVARDLNMLPDLSTGSALGQLDDSTHALGCTAAYSTFAQLRPGWLGILVGSGSQLNGTVAVRGTIELIDCDPTFGTEAGLAGRHLDLNSQYSANFEGLLHAYDPAELWRSADAVDQLQLAFRIAFVRSMASRGQHVYMSHLPAFRFGSRFVRTLEGCGFRARGGAADRLLRSMVDALAHENLREVHALRVDKGPESPQMKRGADLAWRRDIDDEWHLHYWAGPSGIEFGIVGPHNCFDLPLR